MKPTTGNVGPRDHGAHGTTLGMQSITRPAPEYLHTFEAVPIKVRGTIVGHAKVGTWHPFTKDGVSRTKGKASKFPRPRRARELRAAHPHPWREQLAAAKAGAR